MVRIIIIVYKITFVYVAMCNGNVVNINQCITISIKSSVGNIDVFVFKQFYNIGHRRIVLIYNPFYQIIIPYVWRLLFHFVTTSANILLLTDKTCQWFCIFLRFFVNLSLLMLWFNYYWVNALFF